ncbi:protein SPMIP1-like [Oscarella lobularis]|uniref:protein SPMIP1-like n=1 Tax=Oscarella lobularis TaxID=121494 RepID=UPI00331324E5
MSFDTRSQNFWKESVDKEAQVRLQWHLKYSKEFARGTAAKKVRQSKPLLVLKPIVLEKQEPRNETPKDESKKEKKSTEALLETMRPVSGRTKKLLYTGLSAEGEGRESYLHVRKEKKPEQKYEYPMTSAWEYGWKIMDLMGSETEKAARFGRTKIIRDSFYRTNGIF